MTLNSFYKRIAVEFVDLTAFFFLRERGMRFKTFIYYDFEVFKQDWLVVMIIENTVQHSLKGDDYNYEVVVVVNNPSEMKKFYELHKEDIWIGYNSNNYDQWILKGILADIQPFLMNDWIIAQKRKGWEFPSSMGGDDLKKYKVYNYDIYNRVSDGGGLKGLESSMGLDIKETKVRFDIDRKLTKSELEEVVKYCYWDVASTVKVFKRRYETFETDMGVVELINEERKQKRWDYISKSETQLTALMLKAQRPKWNRAVDEFKFSLPKNIRIKKYKEVVDWYANEENRRYTVWSDEKGKEVRNILKLDVSGTPHIFGFGGLHGSKDKFSYTCKEDEVILCADVSSFYPSYLIKYNALSRNVPDPKKYKEIYEQRLIYKKEGNHRQKPLKLVLNKCSGGMKAETSELYDPKMNNQMCVSCQLFLLDLAEHLENENFEDYLLLQSNTDAVYFKIKKRDLDRAKAVCQEWMDRTQFELEFLECTKIFQKDVNNYLMVTVDGKTKVKGAYVKEQDELSRDLPVVRNAMVEYMVNGTPVEEYIKKDDELIDFMLTTKASGKYLCAVYGDERLNEKCNRVFASLREEDAGKGIYKVPADNPMKDGTLNLNKFPNSPDSCFINNGNIIGKKAPDYLDKEFYIKTCIKRLKDFGINYVRADGVVYEEKISKRDETWKIKTKALAKYFSENDSIKGSKVVVDDINVASWFKTLKKNLEKLNDWQVEYLSELEILKKLSKNTFN